MHIDSLFDYLRRCGGQDFLTFDSSEAASKARELLVDQLDDEGIDIEKRPSIDQFDHQLRLRLKEVLHGLKPAEQTAAVH